MSDEVSDEVLEACWHLVEAWATDPRRVLAAVLPLCDAMEKLDPARFAEVFTAGVEASRG